MSKKKLEFYRGLLNPSDIIILKPSEDTILLDLTEKITKYENREWR